MSDISGGGVPPTPESFNLTQSTPVDNTPSQESELYSGFLKDVDPRDKPVLDKYMRNWDQRVNQRFREIHQQYEPYKKLGASIDDIQAAMNVASLLDQDPRYVWDVLGQEFGYGAPPQQSTPPPTPAVAAGNGGNGAGIPASPYEGLPEGFVSEFSQMKQLLEILANQAIESKKQTQAKQEDERLNATLNDLKTRYGNFDEDFVLAKMWQGRSPDEAVQAYRQLVQSTLNSQASVSRPVPPMLGGNGAVPAGVDPSKLPRQDSKALLAQMLSQAAQQGQ